MSISFSTIVQRARPLPNATTSAAMRDAIAKISPTTYSTLGNGFRVACEENPNAKFATVGLWMDVGSKYEIRDQTEGATKLLELCGFQGTTNSDRKSLARMVDEIGGHLHVETGLEQSYMYIKCAKENVGKAVTLLSDVVQNARLADEDIAAAKQQMNVNRRDFEEKVDDLCMQNLHVCAYDSQEQGLGNSPLGTETCVKTVDRTKLENYRKEHYTANRMVLVGAGGVSHTELDKLAQANFGNMSTNKTKPKVESRFIGGDYKLWNLRYKTCHMAWAFETCGSTCGDVIPLGLATQIHGGFHRSQHEMGQHAMHRVLKVYSSLDHGGPTQTHFPAECIETAQSFLKTYSDTGLCGMYIVGRPWKIEGGHSADSMMELLQYSLSDWVRLSQRVVHQQELEQAKVNMKAQLMFNMDGSTNTAEDIGKQVLSLGRRVPLDEMYARIDDVTPTNLMETLAHYFFARRPVFSFSGQVYILPGYDWLVQMTYRALTMH